MAGEPEQAFERVCAECCEPLPAVQMQCPRCSRSRKESSPSRERVLLASLMLLTLLFLVTGFVSSSYHQKEKALAEQWYAQGEQHLKAGQVDAAINDLRTALVYSPANPAYQLRLAQALGAAGRNAEARSYLLNYLAQDPGSGEANLEMAHLAARAGSLPEAQRYFHNAIFGLWKESPLENSQRARLELCLFLLSHNAKDEAQAELIALADTVPPENAAAHVRLGNLLLRVGDANRALAEFLLALRSNRNAPDALAGAGTAAFQLGEYREARRYLEKANRHGKGEEKEDEDEEENGSIAPLLAQTRLILDADPLGPGLSSDDRRRRLSKAFDAATTRLEDCARRRGESLAVSPSLTDLQTLNARVMVARPVLRKHDLAKHSEQISEILNVVFDIEKTVAQECGPPEGLDQTLLLLAKIRRGSER